MVSVMPTVSRNSGQGHVLNAYFAPAFCCTSLISHTPPHGPRKKAYHLLHREETEARGDLE